MKIATLLLALLGFAAMLPSTTAGEKQPLIRIGISGCDTSHVPAFTALFNDPKNEGDSRRWDTNWAASVLPFGVEAVGGRPHSFEDVEDVKDADGPRQPLTGRLPQCPLAVEQADERLASIRIGARNCPLPSRQRPVPCRSHRQESASSQPTPASGMALAGAQPDVFNRPRRRHRVQIV